MGAVRSAAARAAVAAHGAGDLVVAEREALVWLGFAPPQRASGDVGRPLPQDARYRRLAAATVAARVRALTGGVRTSAPACCEETTRAAAGDATGFGAVLLPRGVEDRHRGDRWLLSPLDSTLGFVPCSYSCAAAIEARRASLVGPDREALRSLLRVRLLRMAPGVDLLVKGEGTRHGGVRIEGLYALVGAVPAALVAWMESLVVRRLLAGREVRFLDDAVEVRQGLVFVKMLHPDGARWVDLA